MSRDLSFKNFLKDLGSRLAAAGVVLGIFFGLGYIKNADFLGRSGALDTQFAFFVVAFGLVGVVSLLWIGFQQYRE